MARKRGSDRNKRPRDDEPQLPPHNKRGTIQSWVKQALFQVSMRVLWTFLPVMLRNSEKIEQWIETLLKELARILENIF
jgi:hypothetical protein